MYTCQLISELPNGLIFGKDALKDQPISFDYDGLLIVLQLLSN